MSDYQDWRSLPESETGDEEDIAALDKAWGFDDEVARLRAAIQDAIDTIERERLYEGSLAEEERILGVLRAALVDGGDGA